MRIFKNLLLALLILQGGLFSANSVNIHTIGDSTMADYDENTTDKRGWCMMFQQFFTSDVTINNRGKSGASSKSFYKEAAYWTTVRKQIEAGDYVFIQFAHNDEKNGGLDGDTVLLTDATADYRGTTAQGTFKTYLRAYVNESRELGATPVLVTPICRKYFSGNTITRTGRHDLGGNFSLPESDHTYDYVYAMKEIATEMSVELIDITALSEQLFLDYGDAACSTLLFTSDDSTHPNALGATLIARLCAQAMVKQNILADYVNASSDLLVNPTNCDFGSAYAGQTLVKELTVSGFDIVPTAGSFTLTCSEGFKIAATKTGEYASSITLDYANGNLDFSKFYISTSKETSGEVSGTLTVDNGNISKNIPLKANYIELVGGTEVKLIWELSTNSDYTLTGPATPVDESFSGMYTQRYASPNANAVWPVESGYDATHKTQRNLIEGDAWPSGDIDEVSTRYIEFGITANAGTDLNIDSIGLYVCGAGGNGMRCRISYSTNNFTDYTAIQEFNSMVANNMYPVSSIPVVKLTPGETLLLRVYPWYSSAATGKTICLADVCIHGVATTATGITQQEISTVNYKLADGYLELLNMPSACDISIYDLMGRLISTSSNVVAGNFFVEKQLINGTYICRISSADTNETIKFIVP